MVAPRVINRTFILLTVLAGCHSVLATATDSSVATAIAELENRVAGDGSVTFRSFEGKWIGTDIDMEIKFLPDHTVHMTQYGYVRTGYEGTYHINSKGEVTAEFVGREWPIMLLQKDSISLLLRPKGSSDCLVGKGGCVTIPGGIGHYWPFRPVSVSEKGK